MKANFENITVKAIKTVVPRHKLDCADLYDVFGEKNVKRIVRSSGISSLRVSEKDQTTSDLCVYAAKDLFKSYKPENIKGIVFVSQTPDYIMPSTSSILQNRLNLSHDVVTFDVNSGCCGYIHGLYLASMIASSLSGDVLLCAGDVISKRISEKDRSLRLIMGDAGTASIIGKGKSNISFDFYTDGSRHDSLIIPAGGVRVPNTLENALITERENGNYRSDQHLFMDGMEIMKFALSDVAKLVKKTKDEYPDISYYFFHQANRFIVEALAKNLKLKSNSVPVVVDGYGNTGSASIPLALCNFFSKKAGSYKENQRILLAGFGVGLSAGTSVVDFSETQFRFISEAV